MIRASHISKTYDDIIAVQDLSLEVGRELFVFLGPNGAGKTTTITTFTGLLRPSSGQVTIDGVDVHQDSLEARRMFGYLPEHPHLYDKLTIFEFVRFLADIYEIPKPIAAKRMQRWFEFFELEERQNDLIEDLSHGMKQKVALIGALIHDPKVLFLDEPTFGLDPKAARRLKDLLHEMVQRGKTIFMTTHVLELAERICDRIGIIHKGRLLHVDTLEGFRTWAGTVDANLEKIFLECTDPEGSADISAFFEDD